MSIKTFELTVNFTSSIEDEQGNTHSSIFIAGGIQGTDFISSPDKDFVGWYGVPYISKQAFETGKQAIRIKELNPTPKESHRGYNPNLITFGERTDSSKFNYIISQDNITKKAGLSSESMVDLIEKVVKPFIQDKLSEFTLTYV